MTGDALDILLVAHGLPPETVGGVEQHVDGLARALVVAGHRVTVYARTGRSGEQGSRIEETGLPFACTRVVFRWEGLASFDDLYRVPVLDAAFREFLRGRRFDVVHMHHLTGMSTGLVDVAAEFGLRSVLTLHDYWLMCPRGQMWHRRGELCSTVEPVRCADCLKPGFAGWLPPERAQTIVANVHDAARRVLDRVDRLIAPSGRVRPAFAALGIAPIRIRVVENGVDTEALQRLPTARPLAAVPLRIGYLGSLIPSKGLDVLVAAVQRLPPGSARLDIWGNAVAYHGDHSYLTRVFASLRPGDDVHYHGPYLTADLPRILAQVDVVAAPALWNEAFGLTVREAMAAGRPAVVSRVGGLQDALVDGDQGFVVEPGDAAGLAAALARWVADRDLVHRMGEQARQRRRGLAEMAAELIEVYREIRALDRARG